MIGLAKGTVCVHRECYFLCGLGVGNGQLAISFLVSNYYLEQTFVRSMQTAVPV